MPPTSYYDNDSTVYYPYSLDDAKALLEKAGLVDTDGNGFVNFPADVLGGADVEITLLATSDYQTDKSLAEGVIAQMERLGLRVIAQFQAGNQRDANYQAGKFDWQVLRNGADLITVVQNTQNLAPTGPQISYNHRAGTDGTQDFLPFEQEMVDTVNSFVATADPAERIELMKTYQRLYTENLFAIGLTQYPGALIINKRFVNVPPGTPILQFNWAEDSLIRERLYVPAEQQSSNELFPDTLPGAPGVGNGPIKSN
jgi:peptide/nickel transport system substrate-binding protein